MTPSPTIITGRSAVPRTTSSLPSGVRSAWTASSPSAAPIGSAIAARSPVTMATWATPASRSAATSAPASSRT
ncbi:MAG TPA: hypothetical protein VFG42_23165 [Baekduia sp.]|nr:hypothetical protein [Baekduia sp.]HET6509716.1 hypothetical protein [Baekduia sp.]